VIILIVVNIPYYIPIKTKQNRIVLSRDNIIDVNNLFINNDNSMIIPKEYIVYNGTDKTLIQNDTNMAFPLQASNVGSKNPREAFAPNTDETAWDITKKNYVIIDRYGSDIIDGKKYFKYSDGTTTYYYRIDDGTKISIQSNILTNDNEYVGTSKQVAEVINLDLYETIDTVDGTGEPVKKTAFIPSPLNLPYCDGDILRKIDDVFVVEYGEKVDDDGNILQKEETNDREKYIIQTPIPLGQTGMFGIHTITKDYNLLYKLNATKFLSDPVEWDIAIIRLTKEDYLEAGFDNIPSADYPCANPQNIFYDKNNNVGYQDPVIYINHKDDTGKTIGTTRLGFINEVTELIIKRHKDKTTNEVFCDDLYIVMGTTKKFIDIGLCDIRFMRLKQ